MKWVRSDLRTNDPAMQLAIDEAMLLSAEALDEGAAADSGDLIRVWEFAQPTVVLGRSSRVDQEVDRDFCRQHGISIQRRSSGGATILGGPGCLMYSVVLGFDANPVLQKIDQAHRYVMDRVLAAVQVQVPSAMQQGICDLTIRASRRSESKTDSKSMPRKFSDNSLRMARRHLLYHGTVLYDFDLNLLASCLDFAPRQPDYRDSRSHDAFVTNVNLDPELLSHELGNQFQAHGEIAIDSFLPQARRLTQDRYDLDAWRFRH
jgi:lipoate-protein ligase A